jgi:SAM-dependent methyltransferase
MMISQPLDTYLSLCTEVYDLSKPTPPTDAYALYRAYAQAARGPILEPMCGTGRFLLPLLEEGFDVHGFDASEHMLNALHTKAKIQNLKPTIWHGFLENIDRAEKYGLVFIPSGSFGLITDIEKAKFCLVKIHDQLANNGIFVFEAETLKAVPSVLGVWRGSVWNKDNDTSIILSSLDLSLNDNVGTTICKYELIQGSELIKTEFENFKVRLYEPENLIQMLQNVGFKEIKMIKAFDKEKTPDINDEVIIYECRK